MKVDIDITENPKQKRTKAEKHVTLDSDPYLALLRYRAEPMTPALLETDIGVIGDLQTIKGQVKENKNSL